MSELQVFFWGVFGGVGVEIVGVFAIRHNKPEDFPHWVKSPAYYIIAGIMVLFGGGFALAYALSSVNMNPILAVQIGASTPLLLRRLGDFRGKEQPLDPGKID